MHKPLWEYEGARWEQVHQMLRRHPVRAVFAGHFHHYYKCDMRDGIQYYVLGVTGGRTFSPELAGGLEHYSLLRIAEDNFTLCLIRPGSVLPDGHVLQADFKAIESLRFLTPGESGVSVPIPSPETVAVRQQVAVRVRNPLDTAITAHVTGHPGVGQWSFQRQPVALAIPPRTTRTAYIEVRSPLIDAINVVPPEIEIEYTYIDTQSHSVPIGLVRRVPLRRHARAPASESMLSLDGVADEAAWSKAPQMRTLRWYVSPYERDESGPVFRVLHAPGGLYFHVQSQDACVSSFQGERMLSDAIFLGALSGLADYGSTALEDVPVVVIYPFARDEATQVVRAFWDEHRPVGTPAEGVRIAVSRGPEEGWQCEGFVPWDAFMADGAAPDGRVQFNVGAWDNDGELFTELLSWAPTADASLWGTLVLGHPASD
jgi:hypothetical protein